MFFKAIILVHMAKRSVYAYLRSYFIVDLMWCKQIIYCKNKKNNIYCKNIYLSGFSNIEEHLVIKETKKFLENIQVVVTLKKIWLYLLTSLIFDLQLFLSIQMYGKIVLKMIWGDEARRGR